MTSRPLITPAPSSFSQTRQGLPRRINDQSQGRFPITCITAQCLRAVGTLYTGISIGGREDAEPTDNVVNPVFVHLLTNDRPIHIESRFSFAQEVTATYSANQVTCGQPTAIVGARWGTAELWPALAPPGSYGEPGLLDVPTPPGEEQRRVEGYPFLVTTGALPVIEVESVQQSVEAFPSLVVHTEASVTHGQSSKAFDSPAEDEYLVTGSAILNLSDYTPEVQEAGFIEWLGGGGIRFRLQIVGLCEKRVFISPDGGASFPVEIDYATMNERSFF